MRSDSSGSGTASLAHRWPIAAAAAGIAATADRMV